MISSSVERRMIISSKGLTARSFVSPYAKWLADEAAFVYSLYKKKMTCPPESLENPGEIEDYDDFFSARVYAILYSRKDFEDQLKDIYMDSKGLLAICQSLLRKAEKQADGLYKQWLLDEEAKVYSRYMEVKTKEEEFTVSRKRISPDSSDIDMAVKRAKLFVKPPRPAAKSITVSI
jgi:hypothetical protein